MPRPDTPTPRWTAADDPFSGSTADDAARRAIWQVLQAETDAWLHRDFEALARHWVQSPQTRKMVSYINGGSFVLEGWDAIGANFRSLLEQAPDRYESAGLIRWERVNIVVGGNMAWVSYDLVGADAGAGFELAGVCHELKIFQQVDGVWKICCICQIHRRIEHVDHPAIEVDGHARVLWMNGGARRRIDDHPGLTVASGRLRARHSGCRDSLGKAIGWAAEHVHGALPVNFKSRIGKMVSLGEDDEGVPLFCWVLPEDGKIIVSFDNAELVAQSIDTSARVYGLSPAQARLAHLIADGHDLAAASSRLGVSVNTLRTQLQRMFDKTGTRSQVALVRALLSADAPIR